jgi:hypothetical protein
MRGHIIRKQHSCNTLVLLLSLLLILSTGCSTTQSILRKITPRSLAQKILPGSGLKKRVMVLPLVDQGGFDQDQVSLATTEFIQFLKESSQLLLSRVPETMSSDIGVRSSRFGIVTHPLLIKRAGELGINAFIAGVFSPIDISTGKRGIWPFRDLCKIYLISMSVNVVDITSGTILLTKVASADFSVPLEEAKGGDDKKFISENSKEIIAKIIKIQGSAIVESLSEEPWMGRILTVSNGNIRINAGKDVGLHPGQIFEVFSPGEPIRSGTGAFIAALGKKAGEIKVSSVTEREAFAVSIGGKQFSSGQIIRFKR